MPVNNPPVISVVLNWNNYTDTSRCLHSLLELTYQPHTILLVDNGSTDQSLKKLKSEFPNIEFIENGDNLGFAAGMNAGIEIALERDVEYIWILNNDTIFPDSETLDRLVSQMESHSHLGALTPVINQYSDSNESWFQQGLVDWKSGMSHHYKEITDSSKRDGEILYNDFVPFCSVLFSRAIFEEVGKFSELFFMYQEDVEFCHRLIKNGYNIGTDLETSVQHVGAGSSEGGLGPTIIYYLARNRWLFRHQMDDQIDWLPFLSEYIRWSGLRLVSMFRSGQVKSLWAWFRGTVDGIRGKTQKGPYP
jgi:GT2 family glycosyltransferase